MPKIQIDYSNTIFYKIYCRDSSINELYIGHTTNFVQRKHAHKQGCCNVKNSNYNCKLYQVMRQYNGWDNWKMDIIAFHECDNLLGAKIQEQKYYEEYKATLNSIEPLPKPKPNEKNTTGFEIDKELLIKMLLKNQEVMEKMMEIIPTLGNYSPNTNTVKKHGM
jgi:hypothetical protein